MSTFIVSLDDDTQTLQIVAKRVKAALPDMIEVTNAAELAAKLTGKSAEPHFVLCIAPVNGTSHFPQLLDFVSRFRSQAFFLIIGGNISVSDYKRLVRTGAGEWLASNAAPEDILEVVSKRQFPEMEKARHASNLKLSRSCPVQVGLATQRLLLK